MAAGTSHVLFDFNGYDFLIEDVIVSTNWNTDLGTIAVTVPEPSSAVLLGLSVAGIIWRRKQSV